MQFRRGLAPGLYHILLRKQILLVCCQPIQRLGNGVNPAGNRLQLLPNAPSYALNIGLQLRLRPGNGALQPRLFPLQPIIFAADAFQPSQLLPRRLQLRHPGGDFIRPFRQRLAGGDALPGRLRGRLRLRDVPFQVADALPACVQLRLFPAQLGRFGPQTVGRADRRFQLGVQRGPARGDFGQFRRRIRDRRQILLPLLQSAGVLARRIAMPVAPVAGRRLQRLVQIEAKYGRQRFLPLRRRFAGKFISPPLEQKCRVHKGIVVHTHQALDAGISIPHRVSRNGPGFPRLVEREKIHLGAPRPGTPPPPDGPVSLPLRLKIKLNPAFRLPISNQRIMVPAAGARLPPKAPGHRIQQRRLAMPVSPAQASDVNAAQVQRGQVVPIAQKIANRQLQRNHLTRILPPDKPK